MRKKKSAKKRRKIVLDSKDERSMNAIEDMLDETFGDVSEMARRFGIARRLFYKKAEMDSVFKERFYKARDRGLDRAMDLLIQRVNEGTPRWVYKGRKIVSIEKVPDNNLLLNLVRSRHPEFRSTSNVNVRASSEVAPLRDKGFDEFVLTEEGNRTAHEILMKYAEWRDKKGLDPPFAGKIPELPSPKEDPDKLVERDGTHLVKDEEDGDDGGDA